MELRRILRYQRERAQRWWRRRPAYTREDRALQAEAAGWSQDARAMAERLVRYFWHAHLHYRHRHGTLAYYPGWPSIYGARNDAIEGVTRLMPLWAAYATSPQADPGLASAMFAAIRQSLVYGTDPMHPGYWGDIDDRSTLICEAADVALALWLGRFWLWPDLDAACQQRVKRWLCQAVGKRTADNNWHLFVATVDAVLGQLDPTHRFNSHDRLDRIQSFAVGDGCFKDGPDGAVDLYNAWGFHYSLYWLAEMGVAAPTKALGDFCRWYQLLFTPTGLPLFGRSLCYRFAACTPLLLCAARELATVTPGVAVSAMLANWRTFSSEGGLRAGRPTQGVFGEDIRWLDPYSGPASSLWSTRSLVALLYTGTKVKWQAVKPESLPAILEASSLRVSGLGATLSTQADPPLSRVRFDGVEAVEEALPLRCTVRDQLREWFHGVASRPSNNLRRAGRKQFCSELHEYR
jgi:hypothetical protein